MLNENERISLKCPTYFSMETKDFSHKFQFGSSKNAIVTLQFGDYSNLIGAQFWNSLQKVVNSLG